jgi:hypothetical protein
MGVCSISCGVNRIVGGDHAYCECECHGDTLPAIPPSRQRRQKPGETHTDACWAMPECAVCGLRKKPQGRDDMSNSYCGVDCEGYNQEPRSGHFWPGEVAEDQE